MAVGLVDYVHQGTQLCPKPLPGCWVGGTFFGVEIFGCLFVCCFFFEWFFGPFDICLRDRVNISCLRMAQIGSLMVQVGREIDLVYRCLKIWGC